LYEGIMCQRTYTVLAR